MKRLQSVNRRLSEEHIAYILKETAKALVELHRQHFVHRDVRGSNILLTADGDVKLCDFGLTKSTGGTFGKRSTCIGSPCWMAPEMFGSAATTKKNDELYGSRIDVWALGKQMTNRYRNRLNCDFVQICVLIYRNYSD